MVRSEIDQNRERFLAGVERLIDYGLSNADIGRALEMHRNAIFYWRNGEHKPTKLTMAALKSKLDALLVESGLEPTPPL